jgi:carboxymethylenebutenolidase
MTLKVDINGLRALSMDPTTPAPWPGMVVLHEAAGLNLDIKRIVEHLVGLGYATVAPDLFSGAAKPLCIARAVRDAFIDPSSRTTTDRIEEVRQWLAARDEVDPQRIGVIGFCMGGGFAVVAAARSPFTAAAVNYGRVPNDTSLLQGSCPVVANYGADDRLIPRGTPERLEAALTAQGVPVDVEVIEGVGHSFMNHEPAIAEAIGIGFDAVAADRAWDRIEHFFAHHLGPDQA